jgi:1,4-dihydroxy-2-naphthoate octaprenyltransferase
VFLGGARPSLSILLAFVAVHVGIYGGMTAFNSYYDRDRGPIGFLKHPVPASAFVRDAALVLQLAAVGVLFLMRPVAALPAGIFAAMGIAYSHPRWRWKASLAGSLVTIGCGQGILGFATGFLCAGAPAAGLLGSHVALAAVGSALITLGLYPVTQVYQIDEDRARGDRSLPVVLGWRRALVLGAALLGAGVGLVVIALRGRIAPAWAWILAGGVMAMWFLLYLWSRRFDALDPYANHDWAMAVGTLASASFWVLILTEWARRQG